MEREVKSVSGNSLALLGVGFRQVSSFKRGEKCKNTIN